VPPFPFVSFFSSQVTSLGWTWWPGEGVVAVDHRHPWQLLFGSWAPLYQLACRWEPE